MGVLHAVLGGIAAVMFFLAPRTLATILLLFLFSWEWYAYSLCIISLLIDYHAYQAITAGVEVKMKAEKPRQ